MYTVLANYSRVESRSRITMIGKSCNNWEATEAILNSFCPRAAIQRNETRLATAMLPNA